MSDTANDESAAGNGADGRPDGAAVPVRAAVPDQLPGLRAERQVLKQQLRPPQSRYGMRSGVCMCAKINRRCDKGTRFHSYVRNFAINLGFQLATNWSQFSWWAQYLVSP